MCAKGPSGLDDLHSATNDLLGHLVDIVYKHRGDGKYCASRKENISKNIFIHAYTQRLIHAHMRTRTHTPHTNPHTHSLSLPPSLLPSLSPTTPSFLPLTPTHLSLSLSLSLSAVVCFAGDALICVFRASPDLTKDQNYALRALQCACELRKVHNKHLATHIAVTVGELRFAVLGGLNNEWSYVLNGPCTYELSTCIDLAGPRQVVASRGK